MRNTRYGSLKWPLNTPYIVDLSPKYEMMSTWLTTWRCEAAVANGANVSEFECAATAVS